MIKQAITFQQFSNDFTDDLVRETFKLIVAMEKTYGQDAGKTLSSMFVAKFVGNILYKSLNDKTKLSIPKDEKANFVMNSFAESKLLVQDSVAAGCTAAMSNFCGRPVEYYCLLKVLPEPINKEAC